MDYLHSVSLSALVSPNGEGDVSGSFDVLNLEPIINAVTLAHVDATLGCANQHPVLNLPKLVAS